MRLLLVTNRYPANADDVATPFLPGFARALVEEGADVRVVTPDYGERPCEEDVPVVRFAGTRDGRLVGSLNPRWPPDALRLAGMLRRWRRAVRDEARAQRSQALLACWALPSGWAAQGVAKDLGVPLGVWCLGTDVLVWGEHPLGRPWVRSVLRAARARFADGIDLAARAERIAGKPCAFVPSWHALPKPAPLELGDARFVLSVGRLEESKGIPTLMDAADRLLAGMPDVDVHVVGWGSLETRVAGWAEACGPRVHFWGRQSPAVVSALMGRAAALVVPTTLDSIPQVFGEGVQAGAPLVVSDYGDLPLLVRRHRLGEVFPAGDAAALTAALQRVLASDVPMDPAGRDEVIETFSPARAARTVLEALA